MGPKQLHHRLRLRGGSGDLEPDVAATAGVQPGLKAGVGPDERVHGDVVQGLDRHRAIPRVRQRDVEATVRRERHRLRRAAVGVDVVRVVVDGDVTVAALGLAVGQHGGARHPLPYRPTEADEVAHPVVHGERRDRGPLRVLHGHDARVAAADDRHGRQSVVGKRDRRGRGVRRPHGRHIHADRRVGSRGDQFTLRLVGAVVVVGRRGEVLLGVRRRGAEVERRDGVRERLGLLRGQRKRVQPERCTAVRRRNEPHPRCLAADRVRDDDHELPQVRPGRDRRLVDERVAGRATRPEGRLAVGVLGDDLHPRRDVGGESRPLGLPRRSVRRLDRHPRLDHVLQRVRCQVVRDGLADLLV